jgi:hypothetical protein
LPLQLTAVVATSQYLRRLLRRRAGTPARPGAEPEERTSTRAHTLPVEHPVLREQGLGEPSAGLQAPSAGSQSSELLQKPQKTGTGGSYCRGAGVH